MNREDGEFGSIGVWKTMKEEPILREFEEWLIPLLLLPYPN